MASLIVAVVAALLGGWVTYWFGQRGARELRNVSARIAANLVATELKLVSARMLGAAAEGVWWLGSLPSEAWTKSQTDVAASFPKLVQPLGSFYLVVHSWNDTADTLRATHARPDEHDRPAIEGGATSDEAHSMPAGIEIPRESRDELTEASQQCDDLVKAIRGQLDAPKSAKYNWVPGAVLVLSFLLMVALLVAYAEGPAPVSDQAVAVAAEQALGPGNLVECSSNAGGWACTDTVAKACPSTATAKADGAAFVCSESALTRDLNVFRDRRRFVAVDAAAAAERKILAKDGQAAPVVELKPPHESRLKNWFRRIRGTEQK